MALSAKPPSASFLSAVDRLYYFGTFNPMHQGHIAVVQAAQTAFADLPLSVIPTGQPPHRSDTLVDPAHRLAMARLAVAALDHPLQAASTGQAVSVLDIECTRPGPHYTVTTLQQLMGQAPETAAGLLMGLDTLLQLPTWFNYDWLKAHTVGWVLRREAVSGQSEAATPAGVPEGYRFAWLDAPTHPASATAIRQAVATGRPIPEGWLAPAVEAYIRQHNLYRAP